MPQQKRRKTAEEILGIKPKRKSAEEILGISAPAPRVAPAQPEQSAFGAFTSGIAEDVTRYAVQPALALTEAVGSAAGGNFGPLGELAERVGRGALKFASAFDPVNANATYAATAAEQDPRLAELTARAQARQVQTPVGQFIQGKQAQFAQEAARDTSRTNRIARTAGRLVGGIAPAAAAGIATGGSVPAIAATTAFQSAGEPENLALNLTAIPALGAAGQAAGRAVAPVLRRIRGRNVGAAVAEAPIPTGPILRTGAVAEQQAAMRAPATSAAYETPASLPAREAIDAPPLLEVADDTAFGVSLGKERARTPGAIGPRFDREVELQLSKGNPNLGTKAERTPVLETISALRKAGLLTGLRTHIKNVGGTGAFQISEELSRIPGAVADMIVGRVTGRRTLTGPSLSSMGRSAYEAATSGIAEAKKALRTGQTKFDVEGLQEIASGSKIVDAYVNGVFRTLKAEDAIFRTYAFRRSLEDRAKAQAINEARKGAITRGQIGERTQELLKNRPADMEAAALLDAEIATFNNSNVISDAVSAGIARLPKGGQFIVDQIVPFKKTPTNVIARMLESSPLGFGKNAVQLARAITKKSFTEAEQRAFAQTFGRASLGSGLIALGYAGYRDGWLTGLVEDDPSRRARDLAAGRTPGSMKVGNTWYQLTGFAPFGALLAIGATLARETAQEQEGIGALPALEVAGQVVGEQPLLIGTKQVVEGLAKPGSFGEKFAGGYLGSLAPTMAADVAEAFDTTQREATGITGRLQSRIPGVRNTLPPAQDVLGQARQDFGPAQAFLDPTRATTDVASENRLFAELVRLDVGLSGFDKKKDETGAKARELGEVYLPAGQQLVSSREYAQATDEVKREAVKILNRRAKFIVEENRQPGASLSPASVIAAALTAIRNEKAKKERKR